MKNVPKNLISLLSTDEFFVSILEAARLSGSNESSFRVHGNKKSYNINDPLEEESTSCLMGVGDHGVVYHIEGSGLYLPKEASSIVDVHFHPKWGVAMPSVSDLNSTFKDYIGNRARAFSDDSSDFRYLLPTSIVGLASIRGIELFFYQPSKIDTDTYDLDFHHEDFDRKFRDKSGNLVISDKTLSHRASKELEKTGRYLSEIFAFSGREDYLQKVNKLNRFKLTEEMEFKDPVKITSPTREPYYSSGMIDAEEELRRMSFS